MYKGPIIIHSLYTVIHSGPFTGLIHSTGKLSSITGIYMGDRQIVDLRGSRERERKFAMSAGNPDRASRGKRKTEVAPAAATDTALEKHC